MAFFEKLLNLRQHGFGLRKTILYEGLGGQVGAWMGHKRAQVDQDGAKRDKDGDRMAQDGAKKSKMAQMVPNGGGLGRFGTPRG